MVAGPLYSVHMDPREHRRPLPVVASRARPLSLGTKDLAFDHRARVRAGPDRWITVRLLTDSLHLSEFFVGQWGDDPCAEPDAAIFALARPPEHYGVGPQFARCRTWLRDRNEVWQFGTEYYGNLKVTVRGLCSAIAREDELFLHGCALQIGNIGLVLCGMSGAGKTTLTAALRALGGTDVKVVNDDWGVVSLTNGMVLYTGERRLHMKYRSVSVLSQELVPHPSRYASENYEGDPLDPHARVLVPREDVFGPGGITDQAPLSAYVVVFRDPEGTPSVRPLRAADLDGIERGQYSPFYQRHERFLDGSLLLQSPSDVRRHRAKLLRLASAVPAWMVNNAGPPEDSAQRIVDVIEVGA